MELINLIKNYKNAKELCEKEKYFKLFLKQYYEGSNKTIEEKIKLVIHHEIKKSGLKEWHKEDIFNECLLDLSVRLDKFNTKNKTDKHVTSYLFKNIEGDPLVGRCIGCIRDYINKWNLVYKKNGKRIYTRVIINHDYINDIPDKNSYIENIIIKEEERKDFYRLLKSILTKKQYYVIIENIVKERTQKDIGKGMGICHQGVSNLKERGLNRLRRSISYKKLIA